MGITTIAKKYNCSESLVYNYLKKKFVMDRGKIMKERATQKPATENIVFFSSLR